ncbi:hypothetical protein VHEMI01499 [[Torrubiella] hemipterigena]|uniref:Integral membrane protein n=1 Tax=[Torrubiella] hemipterigena TaxID=1531966 RepID=A0A0A1T7M7_9HYPO|nr:hypothetical protein VHEMI01499 [[Torrubiella] hemipterigena]
MRSFYSLLAIGLSIWTASALEVQMDQTEMKKQFCSGMYSKADWGGSVDPFIRVKFFGDKEASDNDAASLMIFEWKDVDLVQLQNPETKQKNVALCSDDYIAKGACTELEKGEFVLAPNATKKSTSLILTKAIKLKDQPAPILYSIKKTGYYCLLTEGFTAQKYSAVAEFRNSYGELSATQVPKLPFYGGITLVYTLMAGYWGFLYYMHRQDILPVQNYITAVLVFLVVEMLMTWGFYDYLNHNGDNVGSKAFLIVVAILNAARNSFSFFLLLIVCMGYGVVKPTLGRLMFYCRILGIAHFIFGLIYAVVNLLTPPEDAGMVSLLTGLPLAATMTAFYMATLNSLTFTLKDLRDRKQFVKEAMYKKLWWAILGTVIFVFVFVIFNGANVRALSDPNYVPNHWKTRWFIIDGWLNLVYLADVAWIAYVWRPTANNRRFAMSDEIAQNDDGNFEIGEIGMPGDSDDELDEEAEIGKAPPPSAGPSRTPAAAPAATTSHAVRRSLEGETIFAVDSDDEESEDDKLVKTK